jgi:hypothetical protein
MISRYDALAISCGEASGATTRVPLQKRLDFGGAHEGNFLNIITNFYFSPWCHGTRVATCGYKVVSSRPRIRMWMRKMLMHVEEYLMHKGTLDRPSQSK